LKDQLLRQQKTVHNQILSEAEIREQVQTEIKELRVREEEGRRMLQQHFDTELAKIRVISQA
jgi:hypothetical protein